MAQVSNRKRRQLERIEELELKKRGGLVRVVVAVVIFVVVTVIKESCIAMGVALASHMVVNVAFYIMALVLAGVAGLGSRDYMRANTEIKGIQEKMK